VGERDSEPVAQTRMEGKNKQKGTGTANFKREQKNEGTEKN